MLPPVSIAAMGLGDASGRSIAIVARGLALFARRRKWDGMRLAMCLGG